MKTTILGISIIGSLLLTGCIFAPGDNGDYDYDHERHSQHATIGQELLDLDRALDAGVINQQEFDRAKAGILESHDRNQSF
jgi:hypothetical protein